MKNFLYQNKSKIITALLIVYDIVLSNISYGLALLFRFGFDYYAVPPEFFFTWIKTIPAFSVAVIIVNLLFKLYKSVWRYVSYAEMIATFTSCIFLGIIHFLITLIIFGRMPLFYYIFGWILMFLFLFGIRVSYRAIRFTVKNYKMQKNALQNVLIIGAGEAGRAVYRELILKQPITANIVGFIDDSPFKKGKYLDGIKVLGSTDDISSIVREKNIQKVIIAIPSASEKRRSEIVKKCISCNLEIQIIPSLLSRNDISNDKLKLDEIKIEDLLQRNVVKIDDYQIKNNFTDKTVLITGGGGSIGSELVRQVAEYKPEHIVIFEIYENNAFEIQQEMVRNNTDVKISTIIGSVRDKEKVFEVFDTFKPNTVFHAAAHKHVPFMEDCPSESIKNNVRGTYNCVLAAIASEVEKFILVSTDKAVNPTNVMGASKRICEMIIDFFSKRSNKTEFCAVRFGNVLGSNGSVVPFFKKQIAAGGPVTVTHPEITRYFMTIPEAVSLMLQAAVYAKGGEIFVLDMGEPVKIDDLARNMIILAGYIPDVDMKIEYIGLRPGEKLYEELLMEEEGLKKTENELIYIGKNIEIDDDFEEKILKLMEAADNNSDDIISEIEKIVPTYYPKRDNLKY